MKEMINGIHLLRGATWPKYTWKMLLNGAASKHRKHD